MFILFSGILITYLLAPLIVFTLIYREKGGIHSAIDPVTGLFFSALVAPFSIYYFLEILTLLAPHHDPGFYFTTVIVSIAGIALYCCRDLRYSLDILKNSARNFETPIIYFSLISILLLVTFILSLKLPLKTNDPIQYAELARIIYKNFDISFYPMSEPAENGFIVYCSHPLAYPFAILWHYILQGESGEFGYAKIITFWSGAFSVLMLCYTCRKAGDLSAFGAGAAFLTTPLVFAGIIYHAVDPLYLSLLILLAILLTESKDSLDTTFMVLSGVVTGLLWYQHSSGPVISTLMLISFFFLKLEEKQKTLTKIAVIFTIASILGSHEYIINWIKLGRPIGDDTAVWNLSCLAYSDFIREKFGISTLTGRIFNGLLMMWTRWFFGILPWLSVIVLPLCCTKSRLGNPITKLAISFLCLFLLFHLSLILAGNDVTIRGMRYFLPAIPFLAILCFNCLCSRSLQGMPPISTLESYLPVLFRVRASIMVLACLIPVAVSAVPVYTAVTGNDFLRQDAAWFEREEEKPESFARIIHAYTEIAGEDDLLLTFRMDWLCHYTDVRFIRYLDERLIPFYTAKRIDEAVRILKKLGITHILLPSYPLACTENSLIKDIINTPRFSHPIFRNHSGSLYALR